MFYTVLLRDNSFARAGMVFSAKRHVDRHGHVLVQLTKMDLTKYPAVEEPFGRIVTTQEGARLHFSKPTRDFDDVIEQSIMVCEAAEIY